MTSISRKSLIVALFSLVASSALAAPLCGEVLFSKTRASELVGSDSVAQWLNWEQKSNFAIFRKSSAPVNVDVIGVPADSVTVTILNSAPPILSQIITDGKLVSWFRHPFNENNTLPYFNNPSEATIKAYLTASRSLAVRAGDNVFTLKMPTDRPHGPKGEYQPSKASVQEDILDGINRMNYVERIDSQIGLDPKLVLAKEVAMVADKTSGEGYLFRDLSFMNDGNYYLPALSIPYAGRDIALLNGESPDVFWQKHYAELLGQAKAKLLLRYGLQMETPNSQNMLIQLDKNLRPTGVMVFRDISDTVIIEAVGKALGETRVLKSDKRLGVENSKSIVPFSANSFWRFDEAKERSFKASTLKKWQRTHDNAYLGEIESALNLNMKAFRDMNLDNNKSFNEIMASELVKVKLRQYRDNAIEKNKQSQQNNIQKSAG
jgi:hypothetical protein